MLTRIKSGNITIRGMNLKGWVINIVFCILAAFLSSLMVIINRLNLPGTVHDVKIGLDQYIPLILPFVLAYLLYFPFVYGGWAFIFAFWPKTFRSYAFAMMTIGLITGIVNITYNTYAARAVVQPGGFLANTLIYLYGLNHPTTALPSLHVSHSLCTGFFLTKIYPKATKILLFLVTLITLSTLFIKTHYLVDVIISIFLGMIISVTISNAWEKGLPSVSKLNKLLARMVASLRS